MFSLDKPLDSMTEADLQNLKTSGVSERKELDYKSALPGKSDADRKEFLADVCSFANSGGGHLFFGISEKQGVPTDIHGLSGIDQDEQILRLENMVRMGLRPRIVGLTTHAVHLQNGNTVIVIRIPKGHLGAHMVMHDQDNRCYARDSRGRYRMDVDQLRLAFTLFETVAERIRQFRAERLSRIVARETPKDLDDYPINVIHIIPVSAFSTGAQFDVSPLFDDWVLNKPLGATQHERQYNFDGLLSWVSGTAYLQLFMNGIIESVDTYALTYGKGAIPRNSSLPIDQYEQELLKAIPRFFKAQQAIGVEGPVVILVSLIGVKDTIILPGMTIQRAGFGLLESRQIDRDMLVIPDVVANTFDSDPATLLRPVFDAIWRASGWPRSQNYDRDGNRTS